MDDNNTLQNKTDAEQTRGLDKMKVSLAILLAIFITLSAVFAWFAFIDDDERSVQDTGIITTTVDDNTQDSSGMETEDASSKMNSLNYRTYEYEGISFEYPSEWSVVSTYDNSLQEYTHSVITPEFYAGVVGNEDFSCPVVGSGMSFTLRNSGDNTDLAQYISAEDIVGQRDEQTQTFYIDPVEIEREGVLAVRYIGTPGECGYNYEAFWQENGKAYTLSTPIGSADPEVDSADRQYLDVIDRIVKTYKEL